MAKGGSTSKTPRPSGERVAKGPWRLSSLPSLKQRLGGEVSDQETPGRQQISLRRAPTPADEEDGTASAGSSWKRRGCDPKAGLHQVNLKIQSQKIWLYGTGRRGRAAPRITGSPPLTTNLFSDRSKSHSRALSWVAINHGVYLRTAQPRLVLTCLLPPGTPSGRGR